MVKHFRTKDLIAAIGFAVLIGSMSVGAQAAAGNGSVIASNAMVTLHPAVSLRNGDKAVGLLASSQPMHVVVTLKLRNERQLDQYLTKSHFRPMSSAQFQMLYAPTAEQAKSVADYLASVGFSNVKIAVGNALVEADGRADTAQTAFHTSFVRVKTHDGRDAYANSSAVQIPTDLQNVVNAVLGMQNVHMAHTSARRSDPFTAHVAATSASFAAVETGHAPSDFPAIYGASGMPNVTTVAVGSIAAGPMANTLSDLKSVVPGVAITLMGNTAIGNGSGTNDGDPEFDMDSQTIIAFTGVKQYYFYVAASTNDSDLATVYAQVVSDNMLKAIDVSVQQCETDAQSDGTAAAEDTTFKQGAAQGQTFFVSAGDKGADECNNGQNQPSWPASSPYVTAVGGTALYTSPNTTWQNETVWNDLLDGGNGGTGGSPSSFELIPSWQQGVFGLTNQFFRGVPDIAFDAEPNSGVLITVDGQTNQQYGGTSLSAPLAAAMWARVLQADGTSLGFAAPVIYKMAQLSNFSYASAFHDITSGLNSNFGTGSCCSANAGWDYASGWGSINVRQFASVAAGYGASTPYVSFGTLPALQVTTPIPGSTHTPSDFNGDGTSDILWFNPSLSQVGYWAMNAVVPTFGANGGVTRGVMNTYNVTPGYFVGAVGDFDNDGYADLVFTSPNHDLWLWRNNQHGGWTSTRINSTSYPSQWQLIGAGDVDGDGHDDLLWLDPSECKFGYWTMNGATVTGYHTINIACGYYPISIGYYTPSNRLSIIWTSPANDLYIWDSNGGTTGTGFTAYNVTSQLLGSEPSGSRIVSLGGGYQGAGIGLQTFQLVPFEYEDSAPGSGIASGSLVGRSFDANGNQTGISLTSVYGPQFSNPINAAGYVIAGNGVNNTGLYGVDLVNMVIGTGGLATYYSFFSGNAPEFDTADSWAYPSGWWVVGALSNGAVAPPWQ